MSNIRAKIVQEDGPESPREWDNLGVMACWHRRYNLGDEQPKCEPSEYQDDLPEGSVILPLYLYDHSGITMSTSGFSCPWDSGQVGIIYATPDKIRENFSVTEITDEIREKVTACLRSEVEIYDHFLTGNVWGFVIERSDECDCCHHVEWESVDSCWGFIGDDAKDVLDAMKEHVDAEYHAALEAAWENRF